MPADRFSLPFQQVFDATPNVRSGGTLQFFASQTATPLAVYADEDLSVSPATEITLNTLGEPDVAIFLQNLAYKVKLLDANAVEIWSADPVYGAQFSTVAQFNSVNGSPNGTLAGTAGSPGVPASVAWDYTGNILYVCTQTGNAATAVWTAVNSSTAAAVVVEPQGRLTLTTATPVMAAGVASAAAVYYTPYKGNIVPVYNGATFTPTTFSELTLSLVSAHAANAIYDVFVFNNSGVLTLVTGPAWTTATAGSGARGAGAGTTQLSRINGLSVNTVAITGRNGATTYSINANLATYLGTIAIDGVAGQVTCDTAWSFARKWGLWNAYNRKSISLIGGDPTASWSYATATIRASDGSSNNKVQTLCGLPEESISVSFLQQLQVGAVNAATIGIGINSTTTFSGTQGAATAAGLVTLRAEHVILPGIGINNVQSLEIANSAASVVFFGAQGQMNLQATWLG